jgi:hypothetical protein
VSQRKLYIDARKYRIRLVPIITNKWIQE